MLGRRAEAQAVELRKDVPRPMRGLLAAFSLGEGLIVVVGLGLDEAVQVVWVFGHGWISTWLEILTGKWRAGFRLRAVAPEGLNKSETLSRSRRPLLILKLQRKNSDLREPLAYPG
jgi:hypothetical protein